MNGWEWDHSSSLTNQKLGHLKSNFKKSGFRRVRYQIPTVFDEFYFASVSQLEEGEKK